MIGARGLTGAGAIVAVLLMLLGVFVVPVSAADDNVTDKLQTETGPTTVLGGGDHFFVKFGADAAFGVVWGTNDTPNNVYFVAIKARYLGFAQVYDADGNLVVANHTIKIATLYAVKLEDMLEFGDNNSDGLFQGHRVYQNNEFTGNYSHMEALYKKVDLNAGWTSSAVTEDSTDDSRTWTFDLTAYDLPYTAEDNYTGPTGDNKLNELRLTFHLEANMMQVDDASIPQWRITVAKGMMGNMWWFTGIEQMDPKVVSGKVITYHVKWDQMIQGWDYDTANSDSTLLLEVGAIVGNYIPPVLATAMHMHMLTYTSMIANMNENGRMVCQTNTGDATVNETAGVYSSPKPVAAPRLAFGGDNTKIGKFEWVSNVTVDGAQMQVHAQLMGGVPIVAIGQNGAVFAGFGVLAGMSFPGGAVIDHDPTFSADALVDVDGKNPIIGPVLLGIVAVVAALIVAAVIALVMMEKKPGQKVQQTYERSSNQQQVDWTKYYQKK